MTDSWPEAFDRARWQVSAGVHPDRVIAQLARRQHGMTHVQQLAALGVTPRHVQRRFASGHLKRVEEGVYGLGGAAPSVAGHRMAGVLGCGEGTRLAGWALATHVSILPAAGRTVDVVIPPGRRVRRPGVTVRRVALAPDELAVFNGIPSTSIARMLLDLSATAGGDVVEWAWRQAIYRKLLDVPAVRRLLVARRGERGVCALRELYVRREQIVGDVRSRFELAMVAIIRDAGLPEPECNQVIVVDGRRLRPDLLVRARVLAEVAAFAPGRGDVAA